MTFIRIKRTLKCLVFEYPDSLQLFLPSWVYLTQFLSIPAQMKTERENLWRVNFLIEGEVRVKKSPRSVHIHTQHKQDIEFTWDKTETIFS